jgi:hypothetical protein
MQPLALYSQHFTFFITYEWAKYTRVLYCISMERLSCDKHCSFLGPFVSYEEKDVFQIQHLAPYSQHLNFFVTYTWSQYS